MVVKLTYCPSALIEGSSASPPATCSTAPVCRSRRHTPVTPPIEPSNATYCPLPEIAGSCAYSACWVSPPNGPSETSEIGPKTSAPAGAGRTQSATTIDVETSDESPHRTFTQRLTTAASPSLSRTRTTTR